MNGRQSRPRAKRMRVPNMDVEITARRAPQIMEGGRGERREAGKRKLRGDARLGQKTTTKRNQWDQHVTKSNM